MYCLKLILIQAACCLLQSCLQCRSGRCRHGQLGGAKTPSQERHIFISMSRHVRRRHSRVATFGRCCLGRTLLDMVMMPQLKASGQALSSMLITFFMWHYSSMTSTHMDMKPHEEKKKMRWGGGRGGIQIHSWGTPPPHTPNKLL